MLILTANLTIHANGAGAPVWGMDRDDLSLRLRAGDHEFLREIDFSSPGRLGVNVRDGRRLGDDAFHMLGLVYRDLDLPLSAERLFRHSWDEGAEPWRRESLLELLQMIEVSERYPELELLARAGRDRYGDEPDIVRYLISSLYRQEKDAEVIELSMVLRRLISGPGSTELLRSENALWLAVASSRSELPGWEDRYRELFADHQASGVHSRVWAYLLANPKIASRFSPEELLFFEAKQLLADGRSVEAIDRFSEVANTWIAPADGGETDRLRELILSPTGLLDFYLAGTISGRQSATAARMIAIADAAPHDLAPRALEYAGRLYRAAGNYRSAIEQLERSLLMQPSGPGSERVRWYLLSSRVRLDPVTTAGSLAAVTPTLGDPAYYEDLFAELAIRLAGLERWDALLQAYQAIRDFATAGTRAAYELILAEAIGRGELLTNSSQRTSLRTAYLQRATAQSDDLFSALVASALLDQSGESILEAALEEGTSPGVESAQAAHAELLMTSLLRYGLLDRAHTLVRKDPGLIRPEMLIQLSDQLTARERLRESIQIGMQIAAGGETDGIGDPQLDDLLQRRYPLGFASEFDEVLAQESIDRWVFFALVREESLFDPEIVSGSGAIGLTQLLPATADDVARRMRIDPPDLIDPLQNLRIGARYFAMLEAQFGGVLKALAAYNAGQGRVRSWERQRPELDGVLFHQSIPFEETYEHIRNIVVSAAYYGYLYEGRSPTDTVRIVFGNIPVRD